MEGRKGSVICFCPCQTFPESLAAFSSLLIGQVYVMWSPLAARKSGKVKFKWFFFFSSLCNGGQEAKWVLMFVRSANWQSMRHGEEVVIAAWEPRASATACSLDPQAPLHNSGAGSSMVSKGDTVPPSWSHKTKKHTNKFIIANTCKW